MTGLVNNMFKFIGRNIQHQVTTFRSFHALPPSVSSVPVVNSPKNKFWALDFVRTIVRNNFPKPRENIRVKKLGWRAKLKTVKGRRQIMRRILKGRFYLTH